MPQASVNSWFGVFVLFTSGPMGLFFMGFHFVALGPVIPTLQHMYNTTYMQRIGKPLSEDKWLLLLSLTMSSIILGSFVGGTSSKMFLSFLSPKQTLQLCHVLNIIGVLVMSLVAGITWSYEAMIIGRFVVGICIGVSFALLPSIMKEMCASNKVPLWQSYGGLSVAVGSLISSAIAHPKALGNIKYWPMLVAIAAIPSVIYLVASPWIPESPFYLTRKLMLEEAIVTLRKLRQCDDSACQLELNSIKEEINRSTNNVGIKELFTTKQYRNQALTIIAVYSGLTLTGVNNFVIYSDQVFLQANIDPEIVTFCTIGIFALEVLGGVIGARLVDRFGGKKVNVGSNIAIIFAHSLFTMSQATYHHAPNITPYFSIISVAIFMTFFSGSNSASLVLLGDLTIEPTRATALACGSFVFWILAWFTGFIPPYLQIALGAYSMTIWLGCLIVFLIFQLVYLPDTQGKTFDEIQAHFK